MMGGILPFLGLNLCIACIFSRDETGRCTLAGSCWMVSTRFSKTFKEIPWVSTFFLVLFSGTYRSLELLDLQFALSNRLFQFSGPIFSVSLILCLEPLPSPKVNVTLFLSLPTSAVCLSVFSWIVSFIITASCSWDCSSMAFSMLFIRSKTSVSFLLISRICYIKTATIGSSTVPSAILGWLSSLKPLVENVNCLVSWSLQVSHYQAVKSSLVRVLRVVFITPAHFPTW